METQRKVVRIRLKLSDTEKENIKHKCIESKNAYNHYIFCANFYYKFKEIIYESVINEFKKNKKLNINECIDDTIDQEYKIYSDNFWMFKINNEIIYEYLKQQNINVTNLNFQKLKKKYLEQCKELKGIIKTNLKFASDDIIENILISFYKRNYYKLKYDIMNHIKISLNDEKFINHVKNEKMLFNDYTHNFKVLKGLYNDDKRKLLSEQNILRKFVYRHFVKNNISSDVVINAFDKVNLAYSSYFSLRKKGIKANKPLYKKEGEMFNLIFCGKCIKNRNNDEKEIIILLGDKTKITIIKPFLTKGKEIKRVEIIPIQNGYEYEANIGYVNVTKNINYDEEYETTIKTINKSISIDPGMGNLMTIYNPTGYCKIIKGKQLINNNEYYNKKIRQSIKDNNKSHGNEKQEGESKRTKKMREKKKHKQEYMMNKIVKELYNTYSNKKEIVIGYNTNWKRNVKMGRKTNRKFYEIPYQRIISKMRNKFEQTRIIEVQEGYTSKCDSLMLEEIRKHEEYSGKRIKRGLFKSGNGKKINADLNGAINIMRKHYRNQEIEFKLKPNTVMYNPRVVKIEPAISF
jgi:IS605 OrfB family transposase